MDFPKRRGGLFEKIMPDVSLRHKFVLSRTFYNQVNTRDGSVLYTIVRQIKGFQYFKARIFCLKKG